jgi:hypothetical protein
MSAVELDVAEVPRLGLELGGVLLVGIAQLLEVAVAVHRVVVEGDLGVEGDDLAGAGDDERVDLEAGSSRACRRRRRGLEELDHAAGDGLAARPSA